MPTLPAFYPDYTIIPLAFIDTPRAILRLINDYDSQKPFPQSQTGRGFHIKDPPPRSVRVGGKGLFHQPSIMMVFFSGSFFASTFGMLRLSTPFSSFAPMSVSVSASPT